jgi:hypothetical protein
MTFGQMKEEWSGGISFDVNVYETMYNHNNLKIIS